MTLLVVVMVFIISYIGVYLILRYRSSKQKNLWKGIYGDLISQVALAESESEMQELLSEPKTHLTLSKKLKSKKARLYLIEQLLQFIKQVKGSSAENIKWLYLQLQLDKISLRKLKSKSWQQKAKALQELSHLGNESNLSFVSTFTSHSNLLVRNEAQLAMVRLVGPSGLSFLENIEYSITKWHQLSLLHELSFQNKAVDQCMEQWLLSNNNSVVLFALLLVDVHKRFDLHEQVAHCLYHENNNIRQEALYTLQSIIHESSLQHLVKFFELADASAQLSILNTLQDHGTTGQLPFLFSLLNNGDEGIQLSAARAIQMISKEEKDVLGNFVDPEKHPCPVILSPPNTKALAS